MGFFAEAQAASHGFFMLITAEIFDAITKSIRGDCRGDKRRRPRVGFCGRVKIAIHDSSHRRHASLAGVRDLSAVGIGLHLSGEMQVGAKFDLLLDSQQGLAAAKQVTCVVRWSRPAGAGAFDIGASFCEQHENALRTEKAT